MMSTALPLTDHQPPAPRRRRNHNRGNRPMPLGESGLMPPGRATLTDAALSAEILAQLQDLSERMATKEDLARLVSRELYESQRTADQQIQAITATRLTTIEGSLGALKDQFHAFQLADANRLALASQTTQQQIGQVQQQGQAAASGVLAKSTDMVDRLKDLLLGVCFSAIFGLIIYALQHTATHP